MVRSIRIVYFSGVAPDKRCIVVALFVVVVDS